VGVCIGDGFAVDVAQRQRKGTGHHGGV
jgi:hypothetical protein